MYDVSMMDHEVPHPFTREFLLPLTMSLVINYLKKISVSREFEPTTIVDPSQRINQLCPDLDCTTYRRLHPDGVRRTA